VRSPSARYTGVSIEMCKIGFFYAKAVSWRQKITTLRLINMAVHGKVERNKILQQLSKIIFIFKIEQMYVCNFLE
jgi:hypothetical protein